MRSEAPTPGGSRRPLPPLRGRGVVPKAEGSSLDLNPSPGTGEGSAGTAGGGGLRVASAAPGVGASQAERRIVSGLIALTLFASSLPYLLGYFGTPPGTSFIGTVYNIDDYCNYLSWLRQMGDGHFFLRNLFTTDPQKGLEFNVFFWLLGRLMALTHCSPQAALQAARVAGGAGLLWLIYRFYRHCLPADVPARLTAFGFACLGSGLGWTQWHRWADKNLPGSPVDAWQPEAYAFLSIYTSALMTVSTLLILGALYALLLGEQTGRWKYAVIAGVCGGILGNMHSYDVLHLSAAWGLFLVTRTVLRRGRGMAGSWLRAIVALALTSPTTLYMYYVFSAEAVFRKRADVPTLSPAFWHYALGYGLVFALAVYAGAVLVKRAAPTPGAAYRPLPPLRGTGVGSEAEGSAPDLNPSPGTGEGSARSAGGGGLRVASATPGVGASLPLLFALCWVIGGFLVIYLPFAFQRKMLMGEDIPLCLLAGAGASWLTTRAAPRLRPLLLAGLVLAAAPSNALFLLRDIKHLELDKSETHLAPFVIAPLSDVFRWLRADTPADAAVVGFPGLCTFLPGAAGRAVWAGHWAETPSYSKKDVEFADAFDTLTPDADRRAFLLSTHAQFLFYPNDIAQLSFRRHGVVHRYLSLTAAPPAYLVPVYKNDTFTVYAIH